MFHLAIDGGIELVMPLDRYAESLFELVDTERQRLGRWIDLATIRTLGDQRTSLADDRNALASDTKYQTIILIDGDVAGTLTLARSPGRPHIAELGYMISEKFERRGIVTRAVAEVIPRAAKELGIRRFEIRCDTENARSCAVARRLGFTEEAVLRSAVRIGETESDEVLFR